MLWFLFFFELCFAMHVAAEAKPQSAMKTMKAFKAMKAMKAIKGNKETVCSSFTCMFLQEPTKTMKTMKTMKGLAKPAAKTKIQAWVSMDCHAHCLGFIQLFVFFLLIVSSHCFCAGTPRTT